MLQHLFGYVRDWRQKRAIRALENQIPREEIRATGHLDELRKTVQKLQAIDPNQGYCRMLFDFAVGSNLPALEAVLQTGLRPDLLGTDAYTVLHKLAFLDQPAIDLLLKFAKDVNVRDVHKNTPLMRVAQTILRYPADSWSYRDIQEVDEAKQLIIIEKLLKSEAALDFQNIDGETALMKSIANPQIVKHLIEAGADLNIQDCRGDTALHHCAKMHIRVRAGSSRRYASAKLLIQAGASADLKDYQGRLPVDIARRSGEADLANLLDLYASSRKAFNVLDLLGVGAGLRPL